MNRTNGHRPEKKARRNWAPSPDDAGEPFRMMPASDVGERGAVCSALICPEVLDDIQTPPEHFHNPALRLIWEQLRAMREERKLIDPVTLTQRLADRLLLESVGGAVAVSELFTYLPTATNLPQYVEILREKYLLRSLIGIATEAIERAHTEQDQVADVLEDATTRLVELGSTGGDRVTLRHVNEFAQKAVDEIEYAYNNRGGTVGLPTGFVDLDRMIGGWQKSCTYYIGGRPAMGKSSLGSAFGIEIGTAAMAEGAPVAFFSVEMTGTQLSKRAILSLAEINLQRMRDGFLNKEADWTRLFAAAGKIATAKLWIDETGALTIADFRVRVRRWIKEQRRREGVRADGKPDGVVIIDYLQRMKGSSKRSEDARYLELQEIAQGISQVAKELDIPIIVLAQLKRPKDKRPETEPDMSEFRECGDIEQEAHCVALIHRPHYYVKHSPEKQKALAESLEEQFQNRARWSGRPDWESVRFTEKDLELYARLIIDKQREGPVGVVDLKFVADYAKFENWDANRKLYSNNKAERQVTPDQEAAAKEAPPVQSEFLEDPEA